MKIGAIAFTQRGGLLIEKLCSNLSQHQWEGFLKMKEPPSLSLIPLTGSCGQWAEKMFSNKDALVFVGACGIAVRAIAPWVKDKMTDPAVIVVDEGGKFVIPLLSGHVGGANALALEIADLLQAQPVITTATDIRGLFAVDSWAKSHGFILGSKQAAKEVSAALLSGRPVGVQSVFPVEEELPQGMEWTDKGSVGIVLSLGRKKKPFATTLHLIPRKVILGIGCKRGISGDEIEKAVKIILEKQDISLESILSVASIDRKADEPGLLEFCNRYGFPLVTFSAQELSQVPGNFTASSFVKETVGVDNVCERSAVLLSGGTLVFSKQSRNGITVAAAMKQRKINFKE